MIQLSQHSDLIITDTLSSLNPFYTTGPLIYHLKASENICFLIISGGMERASDTIWVKLNNERN